MYKYITKAFTYDGVRYWVRGKTEKEAIEKMAIKKLELENRKHAKESSMLVKDWISYCIENFKSFNNAEYEKNYKNRMRCCVTDVIGNMRLKDVKTSDCQKCMKRQEGKSMYQIKQTKQMLKFIFERAVDDELIYKNPAKNLSLVSGTTSHRRALTSEEEKLFLKLANEKYIIFLLMYYCGMRPEEARKVEGRDIISRDGVNLFHIRGTKSESADRYVPIPDALYKMIKDTPKNRTIAVNNNGNPFNDDIFNKRWKALKRDMDLALGRKTYNHALIGESLVADDLVPYDLRHTYCTNLKRNNVDIRDAQKLMGHSDISMTANIYTHGDTEEDIVGLAKQLKSANK